MVRLPAYLVHPHLLPLYDAGTEADRRFIVMPVIRGATLAALMSPGAVTSDEVRRIGADLADAVAYVPTRHHPRDVKPSNFLLADEGIAYLADFGFAHAHDGPALTATNCAIGTAGYLAPGQAGLRGTVSLLLTIPTARTSSVESSATTGSSAATAEDGDGKTMSLFQITDTLNALCDLVLCVHHEGSGDTVICVWMAWTREHPLNIVSADFVAEMPGRRGSCHFPCSGSLPSSGPGRHVGVHGDLRLLRELVQHRVDLSGVHAAFSGVPS